MKPQIELKLMLKVTPERVYEAWLNSKEHSLFTGGKAHIKPEVGSDFTAWDGYIEGKILELEPAKKILQDWRTSEFVESDKDSKLEILLNKVNGGCELILRQWDIPEDQVKNYDEGWVESYFEPMKEYFNK